MPRTRENKKGKHWSRWAQLTRFHMDNLGIQNQELAILIHSTEFVVHSFLTGRTQPPLELAAGIADALHLKGNERESYLLEAHLAHATPEMRDYVKRLRKMVTEVAVAKSKAPAFQAE